MFGVSQIQSPVQVLGDWGKGQSYPRLAREPTGMVVRRPFIGNEWLSSWAVIIFHKLTRHVFFHKPGVWLTNAQLHNLYDEFIISIGLSNSVCFPGLWKRTCSL